MKDIRDMKRSDWHRITERVYHVDTCEFKGMTGVVSLIEMKRVAEPLTIHYEDREILIADVGYSWLQLAFMEQFFWVTAMFAADGSFFEIYFDITGGNSFEDMENPTFEDRYLDLALFQDKSIHVLDRDELDEALFLGNITKKQHEHAVETGEWLYGFLEENKEELVEFCIGWRKRLLAAETPEEAGNQQSTGDAE